MNHLESMLPVLLSKNMFLITHIGAPLVHLMSGSGRNKSQASTALTHVVSLNYFVKAALDLGKYLFAFLLS